MSIVEQLNALEKIVNDAKPDAEKFDLGGKGSSGAGTRIRGMLQTLKVASQDVRIAIQVAKKKV